MNAALWTALCVTPAMAQDPPQPASAARQVGAALDAARQEVSRAPNRVQQLSVAGWEVVVRRGTTPKVVATRGPWRIVGDRVDADRVTNARMIGARVTLWSDEVRLVEAGAVARDTVFVSSNNTITRAAEARLALQPDAVELRGVGDSAKRAE